jgi:phosphatidylglycerophosphate synthase
VTASGSTEGASNTVFPLVRHLSVRLTPLLARSPFSANQITSASLVAGLAACWFVLQGTWSGNVAGGLLLVVCYVMDNCDGEIARIKNQSSEFGMHFDTFVDWIVHSAFFAALGHGVGTASGEAVWVWLGWAAAAGGTLNYLISLYMDARDRRRAGADYDVTGLTAAVEARLPETWREWVIYGFRELSRADFCFIALALALFDVTWVLVPLGAVGAQVYWLAQFVRGAREFHA